ncbi:MAG: hypothetical protein ACR2PQ_13145 [Myxococcota bacterium]
MQYTELVDAIEMPGLRLVLTPDLPGPWGEAAKGLFAVKKIAYTPVRQPPEGERDLLLEWTGQLAAPVAMYEKERARSGWSEILFLAERLEPLPRLIPEDPRDRALMLGLCFEICGEQGLGWSRRLGLLPPSSDPEPSSMPFRYGLSESERVEAHAARVNEILALLADQLNTEQAAGRDYFVGGALSALDVYWAAFANLIAPLPHEQNPMPDWLRPIYDASTKPEIDAPDPALLAHRERIWAEYIGLPLEF